MKKFFSLFINENVKLFKKKSTIVMLILSVVALLASVGITKLMQVMEENVIADVDNTEMLKSDIEYMKQELTALETKGQNASEIYELKARIEMYEFAQENNIDIYTSLTWKSSLIDELVSYKANYLSLTSSYNLIKEYGQIDKDIENEISDLDKKINDYKAVIKENNFEKSIDLRIDKLKESYKAKKISKEEYDDEIYLQELTKKYSIGKENESNQKNYKSSILSEISSLKASIRSGINSTTGYILTYEEIEDAKNTILLDEYRLENNIPYAMDPSTGEVNNYREFYSSVAETFSMMFIGLYIIMAAGASISDEISKGTIKFLVMTPNKRWKILLSKILTYVIQLIILTVVLSLISFILGSIFFGDYSADGYLYVKDGVVNVISSVPYSILRYLTYAIDIFLYMLFAVMLSTVTRNSAVSISIPIATYIGSSTVMQIINMMVKSDLIKFIPFNNMNLTEKIFSNANSVLTMSMTNEFLNNVSVEFSIIVLAICAILMLITLFESFNKRDIV